MGDGFGYRPRIRLMDTQLTLDPALAASMQSSLSSPGLPAGWARPDFSVLMPQWGSILTPPNPLTTPMPTPPPSLWSFTPGAGPATPRPGQMSDLTGAIYGLPVTQMLVGRVREAGAHQLGMLRRDWDRSSTGERVGLVTFSARVAGSSVAMLMANQPTRDGVIGLINGRDIPVPGVGGLSFNLTIPTSSSGTYGMGVSLDVMQLMRR
jgi:hypothetical protein